MTILTAVQSAAIRLNFPPPSSVFSSSDRFSLEMSVLCNEVVTDIIKGYDWRALVRQYEMVGDGSTTAFPLPDDYDRMPKDARVGRMNWYTWGYVDAPDLNFWNDLVNGLASPSPGYWIILDRKVQFMPAVDAGTTAEFYYISKAAVYDTVTGSKKSTFTADTDEFVLDERLLTLGLIWRWNAMKQFNYAENLQDYEIRFNQISGEDKGARIVRMGRPTYDYNAQWAYPRNLGV